jgi:23S rRNA (guanosine2251-2'-O)-methyltransferase
MAKKSLRWVVGFHSCQETLKVRPDLVREIVFLDINEAKKPYWEPLLAKMRIKPQIKSAGYFRELSEFGHQGVAIGTEHWPTWEEKGAENSLLLFLDGLEDPHNLGAIIRTAWLMGVDCIGVTEKNSVKMTPTVCKIASGGAEYVPVQEFNFVSDLKDLKERGYWTYGFSDKGTGSLYSNKFPAKTVLVFGSEEKGVRSSVLNMCDEVLSIPQKAVGASYNVSVSVGIGLSEFCRQTRQG